MMTRQELVERHGAMFFDAVTTIYVNFYMSELQIIDLCGKWIPRRTNLREKFFLVHHAADEIRHAEMFRDGFEKFGVPMSDEMIARYFVDDMGDRFARLRHSDDELEVLVGLNLYAEGVLAMLELEQLGRNMPEIFPDFLRIATDEKVHLAYGKTVVARMLRDEPSEAARASSIASGYRAHLDEYLWKTVDPLIAYGVSVRALDADYREQAVDRYEKLIGSLGIELRSPSTAAALG